MGAPLLRRSSGPSHRASPRRDVRRRCSACGTGWQKSLCYQRYFRYAPIGSSRGIRFPPPARRRNGDDDETDTRGNFFFTDARAWHFARITRRARRERARPAARRAARGRRGHDRDEPRDGDAETGTSSVTKRCQSRVDRRTNVPHAPIGRVAAPRAARRRPTRRARCS